MGTFDIFLVRFDRGPPTSYCEVMFYYKMAASNYGQSKFMSRMLENKISFKGLVKSHSKASSRLVVRAGKKTINLEGPKHRPTEIE